MDLTGVFEVIQEIEEIGARVGDRLVLASHEAWPISLVRRLGYDDARWAFSPESASLEFTYPPLPSSDAHRCLLRSWQPSRPARHLRLLR